MTCPGRQAAGAASNLPQSCVRRFQKGVPQALGQPRRGARQAAGNKRTILPHVARSLVPRSERSLPMCVRVLAAHARIGLISGPTVSDSPVAVRGVGERSPLGPPEQKEQS